MVFLWVIFAIPTAVSAESRLHYSPSLYGGWTLGLAEGRRVLARSSAPARGEILCKNHGPCFLRVRPETIAQPRLPLVWKLRNSLADRIGVLPQPLSGLIRALLIGDRQYLDRELVGRFRVLGWYHLLVISGLHISGLCVFVSWILMSPFWLLYVLRLLSPKTWSRVHCLGRFAALLFVTVFVLACGGGVAAIRAWVIFLVRTVSLSLGLSLSWLQVFGSALILNACLLPLSFFSVAGCMSWGAYAIVSCPLPLSGLHSLVLRQCLLSALSFGFFGYWHPLGFLLAPMAVGMLAPILIISITLVFYPAEGLVWTLQTIVQALSHTADLAPGIEIDQPPLGPMHFIAMVLGTFLCWQIGGKIWRPMAPKGVVS